MLLLTVNLAQISQLAASRTAVALLVLDQQKLHVLQPPDNAEPSSSLGDAEGMPTPAGRAGERHQVAAVVAQLLENCVVYRLYSLCERVAALPAAQSIGEDKQRVLSPPATRPGTAFAETMPAAQPWLANQQHKPDEVPRRQSAPAQHDIPSLCCAHTAATAGVRCRLQAPPRLQSCSTWLSCSGRIMTVLSGLLLTSSAPWLPFLQHRQCQRTAYTPC